MTDDPIELLIEDHRKVQQNIFRLWYFGTCPDLYIRQVDALFKEFEGRKATAPKKLEVKEQILRELSMHSKIEETVCCLQCVGSIVTKQHIMVHNT